MVTETIQEPYTVKVARQVPKTVKVQRPVTVCRRVPIDACAPVTVSSPETNVAETVSKQTLPEPAAGNDSPADTVPQFNPDGANSSTSNYPNAESETISTDAPAELPAIPTEPPAQQNPEPAPSVALPSAAEDAPPMPEADQVPTLNGTVEPVADPVPAPAEPAMAPAEQPLPGIKRAEQPAPLTIRVNRPIESVLVPEPQAEPVRTALIESPDDNSEYFKFVSREENVDTQKQVLPIVSPTQLLPF